MIEGMLELHFSPQIMYKHKTDFLYSEVFIIHSVIFPRGVVHRVGNGWGLTKVAVVLLNGLIW